MAATRARVRFGHQASTTELCFLARDDFGRDLVLKELWDDAALGQVAYLAELRGRTEWLRQRIDQLLIEPILWKRAKGLTLASLSNMPMVDFESRVVKANIEGTWVSDQLGWLRGNVRLNELAKGWFASFYTEDSEEGAWGAFESIRATVDDRFYTWQRNIRDGPIGERRTRFLRMNATLVRNAIDEKRKKLKKTLFGIEVKQGEISPFLG